MQSWCPPPTGILNKYVFTFVFRLLLRILGLKSISFPFDCLDLQVLEVEAGGLKCLYAKKMIDVYVISQG